MPDRPVTNDLSNLTNQSSAVSQINGNTNRIADAIVQLLSRNSTTNNSMNVPLDMNNQRILNVPAPTTDNDVVTRGYVSTAIGVVTTIAQNAVSIAQGALATAQNALTTAQNAVTIAQTAIIGIATGLPGRVNLTTYYRPGDPDYSAAFERASQALSSTGGVIFIPPGVFEAEDIIIRSNITYEGAGRTATIVRLKSNSVKDLFRTDNAYTLMGTQNRDGAPTGWGMKDFVIDGNGFNNRSNPRGRGIYSFSCSMTVENLDIAYCTRQGWYQEYPITGGDSPVYRSYEGTITNLHVIHCGMCQEGDVAGGAGNGGVYWNGPTDTRMNKPIFGWNEGGYTLKIGPQGATRFTQGELFGGGVGDSRFHASIASATLSGTTVTVTTTGPHYFRSGRQVVCYGLSPDANYGNIRVITVTAPNQFTYQVSGGGPALVTNPGAVATPVIFADWCVISEALNGYTGQDCNLSGGFAGQALIRANGFRHYGKHDYLIAGNNLSGTPTPYLIQRGFVIGDPSLGYNNVGGVYIDTLFEDILGEAVVMASSGGYNFIKIRGYANYPGMSNGVTGTLNPTDDVDVIINGASPVVFRQDPYDVWKSYTATGGPTSGALGSPLVSNVAEYRTEGKKTFVRMQITIPSRGTANGVLQVNLPFTVSATGGGVLAGREDIGTGKAIVGLVRPNVNYVQISNYDFTFPAVDGSVLYLSGVIEN